MHPSLCCPASLHQLGSDATCKASRLLALLFPSLWTGKAHLLTYRKLNLRWILRRTCYLFTRFYFVLSLWRPHDVEIIFKGCAEHKGFAKFEWLSEESVLLGGGKIISISHLWKEGRSVSLRRCYPSCRLVSFFSLFQIKDKRNLTWRKLLMPR